ncbi:hypothetical protein V5F32_03490 [Xanthobacter oligotrophicus]|uniref:Lipoprotein n=1 Tax=Xanthobacter oligotrophicus TaxID=2607286 RepID=A0ABW6ZR77_9HYPH
MMVRVRIALAVSAWLIAGAGAAVACSCSQPPAHVKGREAIEAWQLEAAETVVRGRVTQMTAGANATLDGKPVVRADFVVDEVVKGEIGGRQLRLVTLFGLGDCGSAGLLLTAIGWNRPVRIEVKALPGADDYFIHSCGYGVVEPPQR